MGNWTDAELDAAWEAAQPSTASAPKWSDAELDAAWEAAQPGQGYGESFGKSLVKGAGNLASLVTDYAPALIGDFTPGGQSQAARARLGAIGEVLLGKFTGNTPSLSDEQKLAFSQSLSPEINQARELFVGEPKASDNIQRYVNAAGEFLGGGNPTEASISSLLSQLAAGAGGEAAKDLGAPEIVGQLAGGVTPALVDRSVGAFTRPFTKSGQEILAAQDLLQNAGKEGRSNLLAALEEGIPGNRSYAEIAGTPSAAAFQDATRIASQGDAKNIIETALAQRGADRTTALQELASSSMQGVPSDIRGAAINQAIRPIEKEANSAQSSIWEALRTTIPETERVDLGDVGKVLKEAIDTYKTPLGFSSDANTLIKYLQAQRSSDGAPVLSKLLDEAGNPIVMGATEASPASLSFDDYLKTRAAVGQAFSEAAGRGHNNEAAVLGTLQESLDRAAGEKAAAAIGATKDYKQTFGQGAIGDIFAKGPNATRESAIPAKIISTPEAVKQYVKAFGDSPEAMNQLKSTLVDEMTKNTNWVANFKALEPKMRAAFGDDYKALKSIVDDYASEKAVGELATRASKGRSWTAQGTSTMQALISGGPRALLKAAAKNPNASAVIGTYFGGGVQGTFAGIGLSQGAKWSENQIQQIVAKAMVDPSLLKNLSAKASEASALRVLQRIAPVVAPGSAVSSARGLQQSQSKEEQPKSPKVAQHPSRDPFLNKLDAAVEQAQLMTEEAANPPKDNSNEFDRLAKAVLHRESAMPGHPNGNPNAVSPKGATGLMQIMPETAKEIAQEMGLEDYDLKDPETNKAMGRFYLAKMLKAFKGDKELALAAYNAGIGRVRQWTRDYGPRWKDIEPQLRKEGKYLETANYVPWIMRRFETIEV